MVQELFPKIISGDLKPTSYRILDSTGKPHWVRASSRPILEGGRPVGLRGVLTDINNEKQAESEKKKLLQRFYENQKIEAIGTLAGGISHDFNNLLMGIQGRASLMAVNLDSSDPDLEHIQAIEEHVRSATSLTAQLLGTARGGKYDPKPTDLNELVTKSSTLFKRTRKEIQIHTNMSQSSVVAEVDRQQIEQVLLNMYVNAWQAMPGGGELRNSCLRWIEERMQRSGQKWPRAPIPVSVFSQAYLHREQPDASSGRPCIPAPVPAGAR